MGTEAQVIISSGGADEDAGTFEFDTVPETGDYLHLPDRRHVYVIQRRHIGDRGRMRFQLLVSVVEH